MTEFGYVVCALVAGAVLWQVVDELRKNRHKLVEVDFDLCRRTARTLPPEPTIVEDEMGVFISGGTEAQIAAALYDRFCQPTGAA